jgi:hypothetical protein
LGAGLAAQPRQDRLGESCAGLAIAAGIGGGNGQAVGSPLGEEACDGGAAGGVGVEDLGEEEPEGDEGVVDVVAEGDALVVEGVVDALVGEQVGEGAGAVLEELVAEGGASP